MSAIRTILSYQFMVNAFRAGAIVAILAGPVGWFMVLRKQTFAGHTLSLVGFPGAAGAVLLGVAPGYGYFGACLLAALVMSRANPGGAITEREQGPVLIAITQVLFLAFGFLLVGLYAGNLNGLYPLLFGSFLGITSAQVLALVVVATLALGALVIGGRSLLFASVDPTVADASGVNVGWVSTGFIVVLALAVAEAAQITGALLVFTMLVLPAATAWRITSRPLRGMLLASLIGVLVTWFGLILSFYSVYPTGVYVTSLAFAVYVTTYAVEGTARRLRRVVATGQIA